MKHITIFAMLFLLAARGFACENCKAYHNDNFAITKATVKHNAKLQQTVWQITVAGEAGATTPEAAGKMDGAPVLGYVFPTSLSPRDVGFGKAEGIVALALTSHPDFDDTPLWDEDNDLDFDNDGVIWHPHWVLLGEDKRVAGGLSVIQFEKGDPGVTLPPTNPGMPMYMDSPGFQVICSGRKITVTVPDSRLNGQTKFNFDAVTCFMQVNASDKEMPMLGVYSVYSVASGDLSLPYSVK